jgi:hypothetical protein
MRTITKTDNQNRTEDITIDEIKQLDYFKNLEDEELENVIFTIKKYTQIVYEVFMQNENAIPVIKMNTETIKLKAA